MIAAAVTTRALEVKPTVIERTYAGQDGASLYQRFSSRGRADVADKVLYGSDWPNSDPVGTYEQVFGIVNEYFTAKGREAAEKYFWKNSVAAYKWVRRAENQPALKAG